jgi:hypothetical protein
MAAHTVKDALSEHRINREVYDNFVLHGIDPNTARYAVALFMWLDIIGPVASITDELMIKRLIDEAQAVLNCLRLDDGQSHYTEIPLITSMTSGRRSIHFFNTNKDLMMTRLVGILDGVGRIMFNDYLYRLFLTYEAAEEAARARWSVFVPSNQFAVLFDSAAVVLSNLAVPLSEDARSMFFTFLAWSRIREQDIFWYFRG